jgi:hypothetical protein
MDGGRGSDLGERVGGPGPCHHPSLVASAVQRLEGMFHTTKPSSVQSVRCIRPSFHCVPVACRRTRISRALCCSYVQEQRAQTIRLSVAVSTVNPHCYFTTGLLLDEPLEPAMLGSHEANLGLYQKKLLGVSSPSSSRTHYQDSRTVA